MALAYCSVKCQKGDWKKGTAQRPPHKQVCEKLRRARKAPETATTREIVATATLRVNRLVSRGENAEAHKELDRALRVAPGDPALLQQRACVMFEDNRFDESIELFEKILDDLPETDMRRETTTSNAARAYQKRARATTNAQDHLRAIALWDIAAALSPTNPSYHGLQAESYAQLVRVPDALRAYDRCLELCSHCPTVSANPNIIAGNLRLTQTHEYERATRHFRAVLAAFPSNEAVRRNLATSTRAQEMITMSTRDLHAEATRRGIDPGGRDAAEIVRRIVAKEFYLNNSNTHTVYIMGVVQLLHR